VNNINKLKFYSERNKEKTEFRERLLSFSAESFVIQFAIQKLQDSDIQNYNSLREECRLRVLGMRVLRRIFGPKRDEVTMGWRKLHNEELNDVKFSPNIFWVIKSR
jgi:hypothetical protein